MVVVFKEGGNGIAGYEKSKSLYIDPIIPGLKYFIMIENIICPHEAYILVWKTSNLPNNYIDKSDKNY